MAGPVQLQHAGKSNKVTIAGIIKHQRSNKRTGFEPTTQPGNGREEQEQIQECPNLGRPFSHKAQQATAALYFPQYSAQLLKN